MKSVPLEVTMMKRIGELNKENARLKALTAEMDKTINISQAGCRELKAEVERMTAFTTRTIIPNELLKAEVESLIRAGDAMLKYACANVTYPCYATMAKDWNAAKEGKGQS